MYKTEKMLKSQVMIEFGVNPITVHKYTGGISDHLVIKVHPPKTTYAGSIRAVKLLHPNQDVTTEVEFQALLSQGMSRLNVYLGRRSPTDTIDRNL